MSLSCFPTITFLPRAAHQLWQLLQLNCAEHTLLLHQHQPQAQSQEIRPHKSQNRLKLKENKFDIRFSKGFGVGPAKILIPKAASWFKSTQSQKENWASSHLPSSRYLPFAIEVSQMSEVLPLHCLRFNPDLMLPIRVMASKSNPSSYPLALSRAKQLSSVKKPLLRILSQRANKVLFRHQTPGFCFLLSSGRRSPAQPLLAAVPGCHTPESCEVFGLQRQQGSALKSITSLASLHKLYSPLPKILNPGQVETEAGRSNKSLTLKTTNWF